MYILAASTFDLCHDSPRTTVLSVQSHSTHLNKTKAPVAHGLHSISLANAEWQAKDRHKQQPLRELDPTVGSLQLAEKKYTNRVRVCCSDCLKTQKTSHRHTQI